LMAHPAPLPAFLQNWCVLPLAPGSLVPVTALCLALAMGILLRSRYDLEHRIAVGHHQERMRLMLQGAATLGLFVVLLVVMYHLEGAWFCPLADRLGPLTRNCLGLLGFVLAARSLVRLRAAYRAPRPLAKIVFADMRPDPESGRIPEGAMPDMPVVVPAEAAPEGGRLQRGDMWALAGGMVLLGCAVVGWDASSLCLLRLGTDMP
jgi:hypothetical protein